MGIKGCRKSREKRRGKGERESSVEGEVAERKEGRR